MSLKDKVVLITGGAEKAGKIFALEYAKAGAKVVISYAKFAQAEAEQTGKELMALGADYLAVEADMRDISALRRMIQTIDETYGRLDVLVSNASNFNNQPMEEVTEEIWDSSQDIILKGAFFLCQAAAPLMRKTGGKIIGMGGNSYYENWPNFIPHSIAKVGLIKLMQMLAITLSPEIQCYAVCPSSFLDSESGDSILAKRGETLEQTGNVLTVNGVPLHRGNPKEVAEFLLFLSDCNAYMNGAIITLDGGKCLI